MGKSMPSAGERPGQKAGPGAGGVGTLPDRGEAGRVLGRDYEEPGGANRLAETRTA